MNVKKTQPKKRTTSSTTQRQASKKQPSSKAASVHQKSKSSKLRPKTGGIVALLLGMGLVLVLAVLWQSRVMASGPSMSLETATPTVQAGKQFTVKVYADSANTAANAVQAVVAYDPAAVRLDNINSDGSAYKMKAIEKTSDGTVEIVRVVIGGLKGKQLVSELNFVAVQPGESTVSFNTKNSYLVSDDANKNILTGDDFKNVTIKAE